MMKIVRILSKNGQFLPGFNLGKSGLFRFLRKFWEVYGQFFVKKPKKSGLLPGFERQKWAEKMKTIF